MHCAPHGIERPYQTGILPDGKLARVMQPKSVGDLAVKTLESDPGYTKLHLYTVDLGAENLHRLSWIDLNLVWMDTEAQLVKLVDCQLSTSNCLCSAPSHPAHIVDVSHTSDLPSLEIPNDRLQKLCCDARSWSETEGHCRTLVFDSVELKAEVQAVPRRDRQMHVKIRHVHLPHVISAAELSLNGVQTLHLEVFVPEIRIDGCEIDASSHLVCAFLWNWKERTTPRLSRTDLPTAPLNRCRDNAEVLPCKLLDLSLCLAEKLLNRMDI